MKKIISTPIGAPPETLPSDQLIQNVNSGIISPYRATSVLQGFILDTATTSTCLSNLYCKLPYIRGIARESIPVILKCIAGAIILKTQANNTHLTACQTLLRSLQLPRVVDEHTRSIIPLVRKILMTCSNADDIAKIAKLSLTTKLHDYLFLPNGSFPSRVSLVDPDIMVALAEAIILDALGESYDEDESSEHSSKKMPRCDFSNSHYASLTKASLNRCLRSYNNKKLEERSFAFALSMAESIDLYSDDMVELVSFCIKTLYSSKTSFYYMPDEATGYQVLKADIQGATIAEFMIDLAETLDPSNPNRIALLSEFISYSKSHLIERSSPVSKLEEASTSSKSDEKIIMTKDTSKKTLPEHGAKYSLGSPSSVSGKQSLKLCNEAFQRQRYETFVLLWERALFMLKESYNTENSDELDDVLTQMKHDLPGFSSPYSRIIADGLNRILGTEPDEQSTAKADDQDDQDEEMHTKSPHDIRDATRMGNPNLQAAPSGGAAKTDLSVSTSSKTVASKPPVPTEEAVRAAVSTEDAVRAAIAAAAAAVSSVVSSGPADGVVVSSSANGAAVSGPAGSAAVGKTSGALASATSMSAASGSNSPKKRKATYGKSNAPTPPGNVKQKKDAQIKNKSVIRLPMKKTP